MTFFFKTIGYLIIFTILYTVFSYATLPNIRQLQTCFTTSMNKVYLCSTSADYVKLSDISANIKNAIVISEDASFYSHHGFDYDELRNSFKSDLARGIIARGGSTISQQLIKNAFLNKDKSLLRKLKEAILTKRMEEHYPKKFILEKYLNVIELGKNLYGIKDGAKFYFQKDPAHVTPLEAAFLALLLPNPEKYSVSFKKKELTPFARSRAKDILYKMNFYKKISAEEYEQSLHQLETFFKPIPQMEDEPSQQQIEEESTYDLGQMKEIKAKQEESLQKIQEEDTAPIPEPQSEDAPTPTIEQTPESN